MLAVLPALLVREDELMVELSQAAVVEAAKMVVVWAINAAKTNSTKKGEI
jgi:hypothetical protein